MTGNNTMQLNEATIIAAVQMYLNDKFKEGQAPTVTSVKPAGKGSAYSSEDTFTVSLTEPEKLAG